MSMQLWFLVAYNFEIENDMILLENFSQYFSLQVQGIGLK